MSFESEMTRARTMRQVEPERADFWTGYERGLRRRHHGDSFGTQAEHELWLSLADDEDESRRLRGEGYRAGLEGKSGKMGPPRKFLPSSVVTFREEDRVLELVPRGARGGFDQDWLRAAVREKLGWKEPIE